MPKNYPMTPTTERPTGSHRDPSTAFPKMRPDSSGSALKTGSTDSTDTTSSTTTSPTAEPYTPFIRTTEASSGWAPEGRIHIQHGKRPARKIQRRNKMGSLSLLESDHHFQSMQQNFHRDSRTGILIIQSWKWRTWTILPICINDKRNVRVQWFLDVCRYGMGIELIFQGDRRFHSRTARFQTFKRDGFLRRLQEKHLDPDQQHDLRHSRRQQGAYLGCHGQRSGHIFLWEQYIFTRKPRIGLRRHLFPGKRLVRKNLVWRRRQWQRLRPLWYDSRVWISCCPYP